MESGPPEEPGSKVVGGADAPVLGPQVAMHEQFQVLLDLLQAGVVLKHWPPYSQHNNGRQKDRATRFSISSFLCH